MEAQSAYRKLSLGTSGSATCGSRRILAMCLGMVALMARCVFPGEEDLTTPLIRTKRIIPLHFSHNLPGIPQEIPGIPGGYRGVTRRAKAGDGLEISAEIPEREGLGPGVFVDEVERFDAFKTLRSAAKTGGIDTYTRMLPRLRKLPDLTPRESALLVRAATDMNRWEEAMNIFDEAVRNGRTCTELFNTAISAQKLNLNWPLALSIFNRIPRHNLTRDTITYNTLTTVLSRSGQWVAAIRLVNTLINNIKHRGKISDSPRGKREILPDSITINAGIYAAKIGKNGPLAVKLLNDMPSWGISPNTVSYSTTISALRGPNAWLTALELLEDMKRSRVSRNVITYNSVMKTAAMAGKWEISLDLINEIKKEGLKPDSISFNTAIDACSEFGRVDVALKLMEGMKEYSVRPTTITYNTAISTCEKVADIETAQWLFDDMENNGLKRDTITYNAMISACEKARDWKRALELLSEMRRRGIRRVTTSYNGAISACQKAGQWQTALILLVDEMTKDGVVPNIISINSAISACATAGQWETALSLFRRAETLERSQKRGKSDTKSKRGGRDMFTYTTTIHALGQGGELDLAMEMFDELRKLYKERVSIVAYNVMAASCERKRHLQEGVRAAEIVAKALLEDKIRPEVYTCATLLAALGSDGDSKVVDSVQGMLKQLLETDDP
ncbi:hypothetical protein AAMO2058_001117600 [Amorphochlora amoebiformis]